MKVALLAESRRDTFARRSHAMKVAVALLAAAACSPAPVQRLPGGSLTPRAQTRMAASACGYDVALDTGAPPVVRYRYALDALGRVAHITGSYTTGPDESIDYSYDHLDHMTHMLDTRTVGSVHVEVRKADGAKCDRCWNYSTHVGEDKNYPAVCERCSAVLKELENPK